MCEFDMNDELREEAVQYQTQRKFLDFLTSIRGQNASYELLRNLDDFLYSYDSNVLRRHWKDHAFWSLMRYLRREDYNVLISLAPYRDLEVCNLLASCILSTSISLFDHPNAISIHDGIAKMVIEYPEFQEEKLYIVQVLSKYIYVSPVFRSIYSSSIWNVSSLSPELINTLQSEVQKCQRETTLFDFFDSISKRSDFRQILDVCITDPVFAKSYQDWSIRQLPEGITSLIQDNYSS